MPPAAISTPPDANVNVFFHGLFLFVQQKGFLDVLIPNMGIEHVYRAGTFLAEETLLPKPIAAPYHISGITGGSASFDTTKNIVFTGQDFDHFASEDDVYARILLPIPIEIVSLRQTRDALVADFDPGGIVDKKKPCGVQLLRYKAANLDAVRLVPHAAGLGKNSDNAFLNLHIICEEDSLSQDPNHARNGFESIVALMPGLPEPAIFIENFTVLTLEKNDDPARGYAAIETLNVTERANMLAQAGLDWRDGNDHLGVVDDGVVDAPPLDCMPVMSDNS